MSSEWPTVTLGEYCIKIGSGATPKGGSKVYKPSGEICLIRSQNIFNEGFNPNGLVYIDDLAAEKLKNVTVEENDVLLNITGDSVARVCLAKKKFLPARVNQHVAIIRPDDKQFDSRFVRYLLSSPSYQNTLLSIAAVGATRDALTKGMIEKLEVLKPPLEQQVKIANYLEVLERKIELNTESNQTLEVIAQTLFKSWFVDFDPVKAKMEALAAGGSMAEAELAAMSVISAKTAEELKSLKESNPEAYSKLQDTAALFPSTMQESEFGLIPEGWDIKPFSKLAKLDTTSVKPNSCPDKVWEHFSIPAFDTHSSPSFELGKTIKSGKYKVNRYSILSSKLNPHFPRTWWPDVEDDKDAICSTEFMQFVPIKEDQRSFIYGMIVSAPFQQGILARVTGSTGSRQRAQPPQVANMDVLVPDDSLILAYSDRIHPLHETSAKNIKLNLVLSNLRDTLLPKLLSGEIDLSSEALR